MAKAGNGHVITARDINPIPTPYPAKAKRCKLLYLPPKIEATSRKNDVSLNTRKYWKTSPRRLITISTADGRWQGNWTSDYIFTLRDLQLEDLAEDGQKDAHVFINLCIQKVHFLPMLHLFNTI